MLRLVRLVKIIITSPGRHSTLALEYHGTSSVMHCNLQEYFQDLKALDPEFASVLERQPDFLPTPYFVSIFLDYLAHVSAPAFAEICIVNIIIAKKILHTKLSFHFSIPLTNLHKLLYLRIRT